MSAELEKALLTFLEENVRSAERMRIALRASSDTRPTPDAKPPTAPNVAIQVRYVLIPLFCSLTGYTDKAVRRKIAEGIWIEGRHYRRAPDGRITMDLEAYYRWVEGGR